jgi:hypothetical protein
LATPIASAQDPEVQPQPRRSLTLQPLEEGTEPAPIAARKHAEERPFVYAMDPTTPSRGDVSLDYTVGLASGVAADRPLPAGLAYDGVVHGFTTAFGATDRLAPFAVGRVLQSTDPSSAAKGDGALGLRWQITAPDSHFRLTLAGAGMRDFTGALGGWGRLAASYDVGGLRMVGNLHAERAFAKGRDSVDVLVVAGASYRVHETLRVGVEYVGQDLEESFEHQAEGGARHYAGPNVAMDLGRGGFQLVGGPAFAIGGRAGDVLGRVSMVAAF